jgi:hypothetical protein
MSRSSKPGQPGLLRSSCHPGLAPLVAGDDVSWMPRAMVGDDQGNSGACALFSMAAWAEIVHAVPISSFDVLAAYQRALAALGRPYGEGLYFREALEAAQREGWIRNSASLCAERNLDRLVEQPLLGGYLVTDAFYRTSPQGCLDHDPNLKTELGYHAMAIIGKGRLDTLPGKYWVYDENSWGWQWGWNGIGVMDIDLHNRLCREVWSITGG